MGGRGSSWRNCSCLGAMDGQSGDGAREGETLGKGGSDAHSDKSDDLCSDAGGCLPSNLPTEASCIEGDLNAADIGGDEGPMRYEPVHEVDGDWDDQTPVGGRPGTWCIVCGNWGGHWHDQLLQKHLDFDLKSCAGTILLLSEAREEFILHLKEPGADGETRGRSEDPC